MPYTGIIMGVPTSTSYVPPDGVGSWKGIVHTFMRTRPGGYIRSDSANQKVIFMAFLGAGSAFLSLFHIAARYGVIVFNQIQ